MRTLALTHRVLIATVVVTTIGCGPLDFCSSWADDHASYTLVVLAPATGDRNVSSGGVTCGDMAAPITVGDMIPFRLRRTGAAANCESAGLLIDLPGVTPLGSPEFGLAIGDSTSVNNRNSVALGDGSCTAVLHIALASHVPTSTAVGQSNVVLHRTLQTFSDGCAASGLRPSGKAACRDAWFVKITDQTGRVVTTHPDAGM